jgi:hypothetical protein
VEAKINYFSARSITDVENAYGIVPVAMCFLEVAKKLRTHDLFVVQQEENGLTSIANDPCRHTGADCHGRQVRRHHSSGSDHGAITDGDPGGYHGVGSEPHIIADADRRIPSGLIANKFTAGYSMIGREDRYARPQKHVASDGDWTSRRGPYGTEMIDKGMVADLDHLRVLEDDRRGNLHSLANAFQLCLPYIAPARDEGQQVEPTSYCLRDRSDQPAPFGYFCGRANEWGQGVSTTTLPCPA